MAQSFILLVFIELSKNQTIMSVMLMLFDFNRVEALMNRLESYRVKTFFHSSSLETFYRLALFLFHNSFFTDDSGTERPAD